MKKTLTIGDKDIEFEINAITPRIYKSAFGEDFYKKLMKMISDLAGDGITNVNSIKDVEITTEAISEIDFEYIEQLSYACAKTANEMQDEKTPDFEKWLKTNYEFNVLSDGLKVFRMVNDTLNSKKK